MRLRQDLADEVMDPKTAENQFPRSLVPIERRVRCGRWTMRRGTASLPRTPHVAGRPSIAKAWPRPKAMEYMVRLDAKDGKENGVIRGRQHSTWDTDLYGPNGYVMTLYLATLRAAEEMAQLRASRRRRNGITGSTSPAGSLPWRSWNGDYFVDLWPEEVPLPTPKRPAR